MKKRIIAACCAAAAIAAGLYAIRASQMRLEEPVFLTHYIDCRQCSAGKTIMLNYVTDKSDDRSVVYEGGRQQISLEKGESGNRATEDNCCTKTGPHGPDSPLILPGSGILSDESGDGLHIRHGDQQHEHHQLFRKCEPSGHLSPSEGYPVQTRGCHRFLSRPGLYQAEKKHLRLHRRPV